MNQFLQSGRKKRRVLMVDDELINRELLETILSMNYEVSSASSGMEAMSILHNTQEPFSLILLDIIMPQMSGFDVISACKSDDKLKDIPIIVMTTEKSAEVRSIHMGAADFIAKPYRMPEVILARCERIIEQSEERELIRSIEKDPVSGLYVRLFFDAYVKRLAPNIRGKMDAIALRMDGLETVDQQTREKLLRKTAELMAQSFIGKKGIACRTDDNYLLAYCRHKENFEDILTQMERELSAESGAGMIRLRAGVCSDTEQSDQSRYWFERAITASQQTPANGGHFTTC